MCLTQSVKNEQGLVVYPYVRFCSGWPMVTGVADYMKPDIAPEVEARVKRYFENHCKIGYGRYTDADKTIGLGPMAQEIWAHKTCDNQSVLKDGLSMIEGIYGRDGDGFHVGNDYLTNIVMFSKHKFPAGPGRPLAGRPRTRQRPPVPHCQRARSERHIQPVGCAHLRVDRRARGPA